MRGPQIRLPIQLWTLWLLVNPGSGLPLQRSASEAMEESIPLQGVELGNKYDIFAGFLRRHQARINVHQHPRLGASNTLLEPYVLRLLHALYFSHWIT